MTTAANRKDKQVIVDVDNSVREFTKQLTEQQRVLDVRTECKSQLISDLQEFFKRRSEVDFEYGRNLDRLCERFTERFQKQRSNYGLNKKDRASFVNLWSKLLIDAKFKAKTATTLSEIYSKNLCTRLSEVLEDIQRIARNVKDTHQTLQQEIYQQITTLQNDMKSYYAKHTEYVLSEGKFRASENEMRKAEESPLKKGNEKRLKNLEKNFDKKRMRLIDSKVKAVNARNTYILNSGSLSSLLSKYFDHDVSHIVSKLDHNFHNSFSSTLQAYIGVEMRMANVQIQSANSLAHTISIMDAKNDNKMFLEDNSNVFLPHIKFHFIPHADDNIHTITAEQNIEKDLRAEHQKLFETLKSFQVELSDLQLSMEKRQKGLEATYKKYDAEMNGFYHMDMTPVSGPSQSPNSSLVSSPPQQLKSDKEEWETGLLNKFKEHIMMESAQVQAQTKYDLLTKALGEISSDPSRHLSPTSGRKRTVKLFGTSLKCQLDESGREIPELVESCVKYIAKYGLDHQGIFRVPGASQEIADMKVAFEEGRDPLSGLNHWKDINAVAGVFRVYFREMAEPLFPIEFINDYLRASSIARIDDQVAEAKVILNKIHTWNLHVIKYMLKFLNLISRYSDRNKMTSHNLAVVFGPTLFRVPDNENLLTNQGQINVFIDVLINEFYQIFPDEPIEVLGDKTDGGSDEPDEHTEDELDSEDDVLEAMEAIAIHSYSARTLKEVSFNKGDVLTIYSRTNADWWDARVNGKFGFAPVPYIKIVDRPTSVSERGGSISDGTSDLKLPRKSSKGPFDVRSSPEEGKSDAMESPPPSPRPRSSQGVTKTERMDNVLKSASVSDVRSADHVGNVFAAIDPTIQGGDASPASVRRTGSDRSGPSAPRRYIPNRSNSDKIPGGSRKYHPNEAPTLSVTKENDSSEGQTANIKTFSATKQPILPPFPAGGLSKLHHQVSPTDGSNKGRVTTSPPDERPSTGLSHFSSLKQKSPRMSESKPRPVSTSGRPTTQGQIQIENPNKTDNIPSFKPAPPPPALKPKPFPKKKETIDLAASLHAAAAKKNQEGKDITHL